MSARHSPDAFALRSGSRPRPDDDSPQPGHRIDGASGIGGSVQAPDSEVQEPGECNPRQVWDEEQACQGTETVETDQSCCNCRPEDRDLDRCQARLFPAEKNQGPGGVQHELNNEDGDPDREPRLAPG